MVGEQSSGSELAKEPILEFNRGRSPSQSSEYNSEYEIPMHARQLNGLRWEVAVLAIEG